MQSHRTIWLQRLGLSLRTALACLLISLTILYGPKPLQHLTQFPAFSYLTTIIILSSESDSSLGQVLKACVHTIYATCQMMVIAVVSLRIIGLDHMNTDSVAAAAVAVGVFIVALPKSTSLLAKRVAFGQIVILLKAHGVSDGDSSHIVMHPVHVAASTALGAIASLLAMLVPFPRLAHYLMKSACRSYTENASERLNLFGETMTVRDCTAAHALMARAASLSATARTLLHNIKLHHEGKTWERPQIRFFRQEKNQTDPIDELQGMEIQLRGMEMALGSCSSFPIGTSHEELKQIALNISSNLKIKDEQIEKSRWDFEFSPLSPTDLPICFFWYCIELFRFKENPNPKKEGPLMAKRVVWIIKKRLVFALKCSVSLGFAVMFGRMYNKEQGHWSGLTIAISIMNGRQTSFALANARLQGTAMGSVYSLLCCSMFKRVEEFRFLPLLPWIIFTVLLRYSKMYGQAGGVSAAIGALLILGRTAYGDPTAFAIARIVEVSIGVLCFIFTELIFNPTRATTLAKSELSNCFDALSDCIQCLVLCFEQKNEPTDLRSKQSKLKRHVNALETFISEAESEPNICLLRLFNAERYKELKGSFSRMIDLFLYIYDQLENLKGFDLEELKDQISQDLKKVFNKELNFSMKCYEENKMSSNIIERLQRVMQKRKICNDTEAGTESRMEICPNQEDVERFLSSFLLILTEMADKINRSKTEEGLKNRIVLCLSSLGFCISKVIQEIIIIKTGVNQIT